jgi:hypothetical protein
MVVLRDLGEHPRHRAQESLPVGRAACWHACLIRHLPPSSLAEPMVAVQNRSSPPSLVPGKEVTGDSLQATLW